ncbi:MAG: hypothetical protein ACQESE_03825 [Nanobdellota archaeon]
MHHRDEEHWGYRALQWTGAICLTIGIPLSIWYMSSHYDFSADSKHDSREGVAVQDSLERISCYQKTSALYRY